jgi:Histidine kinase-like ATPase domain
MAQSSDGGSIPNQSAPKHDGGTAVELRFTAQPEHVRTARLVAVALARRAGVEAGLLDEVRLAVGEACSRAVGLHQRHSPGEPVLVVLDTSDGTGTAGMNGTDGAVRPGGAGASSVGGERFHITVADRVSGVLPSQRDGVASADAGATDDDEDEDDAEMGLAVLTGLVDDLDIRSGPEGGAILMSWPIKEL